MRECWECSRCGHIWLKTTRYPPRRCAYKPCGVSTYVETGDKANTITQQRTSNGYCIHCGRPLKGRQEDYCGNVCKMRVVRGSMKDKASYRPPEAVTRGKAGEHHPLCACIPCLLLVPKTLKRGSGVKGIGHRVYRKQDGGVGEAKACSPTVRPGSGFQESPTTLSGGGGVGVGG